MSRLFQNGIPNTLFVGSITSMYYCSICREVLNDPVQCRAGHIFCRSCVREWLRNHKNCPECRIDLSMDSLSDALLIRNHLNSHTVLCKTVIDSAGACKWTGQLQELETHLSVCEFNNCPHCGQHIIIDTLTDHIRDCKWRPVDCKYGCGQCVAFINLESHWEECTNRPVQCPFTKMGFDCSCGGTVAYIDFKKHIIDPNRFIAVFNFIIAEQHPKFNTKCSQLEEQLKITEALRNRLDEQLQVTDQNWIEVTDSLRTQLNSTLSESDQLVNELNEYLQNIIVENTELRKSLESANESFAYVNNQYQITIDENNELRSLLQTSDVKLHDCQARLQSEVYKNTELNHSLQVVNQELNNLTMRLKSVEENSELKNSLMELKSRWEATKTENGLLKTQLLKFSSHQTTAAPIDSLSIDQTGLQDNSLTSFNALKIEDIAPTDSSKSTESKNVTLVDAKETASTQNNKPVDLASTSFINNHDILTTGSCESDSVDTITSNSHAEITSTSTSFPTIESTAVISANNPVKVLRLTEGEYEGEIKDNKPHGKGITFFNHNDAFKRKMYSGEWRGGFMDGKGILTYVNGDTYDGEWKDNMRNGKGEYKFASGNIYNGDWKDDKKNGQGVYIWASGNTYKGGWKDDMMHGDGLYAFANGSVYEGHYIDGKRHTGHYTYPDGLVEVWSNGKRVTETMTSNYYNTKLTF